MKNKHRLFTFSLFLVVPIVLLGLDLRFRGLVWQFLWYQTGEETPLGQIRGFTELLGNLIRPALDTQPLTPIRYTDQNPYGINVFLQKEVEEPKIRAMLAMIQEAGFTLLRQEFPWEDLEVDGRGQFTDTRNDTNGDGTPDTINAWAKYDRLVALTEDYDLRLLVRLSNPPDWAIANNPEKGTFAPPDDVQDFVNYAVAVATRYKGRIQYYQIWNEPNIYPEWGNQFADPKAYTDMLCQTYQALKAVDPTIVVLSAAIAPTISLDGFMGYQDLVYLQNMYDNGAGACFDILSAQGYGLFSGPYDRRLRQTTVNLARHTYYRDIMVKNDDADKPIWISEAAWNAVADATLPADQIADYARFGIATQDQAARYMPLMFQRAQEEWSWVGNISYWFFTRSDPSEMGQSFYYFRMVEPDYSAEKPTFTPLPVYNSVKDYLQQQIPTLYRGVHQAESWKITHDGQEVLVSNPSAQLEQALETSSIEFTFTGTDVSIRYSQAPDGLAVLLDGQPINALAPATLWKTLPLFESVLPETHTLSIRALNTPFLADSIVVDQRMWHKIWVPLILGACFIGFVVIILVGAIRERLRR